MNREIISALSNIENIRFSENESMSKHTTFKIGGPAELFIEALSSDAAIKVLGFFKNLGITPLIIGNGSNLLFPDELFEGVVLKFSSNNITVSGNTIRADAGALMSSVSAVAMKHSLSGLEFAQGIPGTVGGAISMNAGAYGGEIADVLVKSTFFADGKVITLTAERHDFCYRHSFYTQKKGHLILSAEFNLASADQLSISEKMKDLANRRREKQPLEFPSAGSVFKRPEGHFAGALIEQCGLKGFSIGGAEVSKKHAGFIINRGDATSDDVKRLISHIQETVLKEAGVSLECEICIL